METKDLPTTELHVLLDELSVNGAQHLVQAETDLMQTNFLLSTAIEQLAASFMQINLQINAQHAELEKLIHEKSLDQCHVATFSGFKEKIADEINSVITALQFQDLTNQLLTKTMERLNGLRNALSELSANESSDPALDNHIAAQGRLQKVNKNLCLTHGDLQAGLRKQVTQEHMESGDIELF